MEQENSIRNKLKYFFFPTFRKNYLIRIFLVMVSAWVIFSYVLIPVSIDGHSMSPTYLHGQFNFCNSLYYSFFEPRKNDVVFIRLAGKNIMYLKRIVALSGETVEFLKGRLIVSGVTVEDAFSTSCHWTLPPRSVTIGNVYVVGDNRSTEMDHHVFGQVSANRISGVPLW